MKLSINLNDTLLGDMREIGKTRGEAKLEVAGKQYQCNWFEKELIKWK